MQINYLIGPRSKCFLFLDVPFIQGANHIGLARAGGNYGLSLAERIKHLVMGILKCIPGVGHIVALVDTLCQTKFVTHIKLTSKQPFEKGMEHGQLLKDRIKEVYGPILGMKRNDVVLEKTVAEFEKQIPVHLKEEMKGLAEGSGYSYKEVLLIHSFLDAQPGQFGCTSMVVKKTHETYRRIAAANHSLKLPLRLESRVKPRLYFARAAAKNDRHAASIQARRSSAQRMIAPNSSMELISHMESQARRQAFLNQPISKNEPIQEVLKAAGKADTIQSMVFDCAKGEVALSSSGSNAVDGKFRKFGPDLLFGSHEFSIADPDNRVRLFRNLDWPWYFLGQQTVVLTRPQANGNSTVSISWPGYIGTLSGMNNHGLALTQNQCGQEVNSKGIPNPLLFTDILDTCKNVSEASRVIEKGLHGSSMNVVIADKTSAKNYELQGNGAFTCVEEIQ